MQRPEIATTTTEAGDVGGPRMAGRDFVIAAESLGHQRDSTCLLVGQSIARSAVISRRGALRCAADAAGHRRRKAGQSFYGDVQPSPQRNSSIGVTIKHARLAAVYRQIDRCRCAQAVV